MQVPLDPEVARSLAAASEEDQAILKVDAGTKVRVDEIDCTECRRGIGRCAAGDPTIPCEKHR